MAHNVDQEPGKFLLSFLSQGILCSTEQID